MSKARYLLSTPGVALLVDADPNTTEPLPQRVFQMIPASGSTDGVWIGATGGTASVALWIKDKGLGRWLKIVPTGGTGTYALTADSAQLLPIGQHIFGCDTFLQITVAGGATGLAVGTSQS